MSQTTTHSDIIEVQHNNETIEIPRTISTHDTDVEPHGITDKEFTIDRVYVFDDVLRFESQTSEDEFVIGMLFRGGTWVLETTQSDADYKPGETLWEKEY